MDSWLLLVCLFIIMIIALPVVIIVQVSSLKQQIRNLGREIDRLRQSESVKASDSPRRVVKEEAVKEKTPIRMPPPIPQESVKKEVSEDEQEETLAPDIKEEEEARVTAGGDIPVYTPPPIPQSVYNTPPVLEPEQAKDTTTRADAPPVLNAEKEDQRSFVERILGDNWLSKIGIVTLVLGIAFFVKYAIDQNWINEIGRVGIGLLTGGLIIGIAHKLKAKYHVFSSILVGGGISVLYITITLAFREYELFGQTIAFVLLIITTVFSVLLSLLYDRKELAIFSLLGGFASPLMVSTGAGNYIVLFSYILILNAGMLVVSFIKQWRIIGMICYLLTLSFFWTWIFNSYNNEFFSVALFAFLFFAQFYLRAIFDHFKSGKTISPYQIFLILSNNLSAYLAFLYIYNSYSVDIKGAITISLALINAVVMVALFRNNRIDRNLIYLLIAIVMSFVSLAIPVQLKGHAITLFWAAESVVLLWLWQKSRIHVFHIGYILISVLTFFSYLMDIGNNYSQYGSFAVVFNRMFITGIGIIASYTINIFLMRNDKEHLSVNLLQVRLSKLAIIFLSYLVPYLELNVQLSTYTDTGSWISSFRIVALATFTVVYIAILGLIYRKRISTQKYIFGLLYLSVFLYATIYSFLLTDLRYDIFQSTSATYPVGWFSIHLLALPAIAYVIYLLISHIKSVSVENYKWLSWVLLIMIVGVLSVETDHLVIWLLGNYANYYTLLYDVHTFGYPILWGVIAMILMIWGLNRKEALLRMMSLVFFGVIIVKFYAYDVWYMSQAGRIISFVLLGGILLVVSFLQQKIRSLVKENKTEGEESEKSDL